MFKILVLSLFIITPYSATAETIDAFISKIEKAFSIADVENRKQAMLELFYLPNADGEDIKMYHDRIIDKRLGKLEAPKLGTEALPEDFVMSYVNNGIEFKATLTPVGMLTFNEKMKIPYGKKPDGNFALAGMLKHNVIANAPEDVVLNMMVMGMGNPPVRFSGYCDVMQANNKTRRMTFEDNNNGNNTLATWAQYVHSCEVKKLSTHGTLQLRITAGDTDIFKKVISEKDRKIIYQH